jgi:hypothetical protein
MELYVNLLFPRTKAQSPFPAGRAPGQPAGTPVYTIDDLRNDTWLGPGR